MNKELFAETENKVRRYYQKDKIINSLNSKINLLNRQIKSLEDDLKNCNINIDPGIKPLSYEEIIYKDMVAFKLPTERITFIYSKNYWDSRCSENLTNLKVLKL